MREQILDALSSEPMKMERLVVLTGGKLREKNFHDTQERRVLTSIIDEINRDRYEPAIIYTGSEGVKIADREAAIKLYERYRHKALRTLAKAAVIAEKINLDRQLGIDGEEVRIFMEETK